MRPQGLSAITIAMCITNAMGWFIVPLNGEQVIAHLAINSLLILIGYVVLWYFWLGKNWARWLVLINCAVCFFNLFLLGKHGAMADVMVVSEAAIAAFLVVWLNIPHTRAYFVRP
jgi:hypothetical protein